MFICIIIFIWNILKIIFISVYLQTNFFNSFGKKMFYNVESKCIGISKDNIFIAFYFNCFIEIAFNLYIFVFLYNVNILLFKFNIFRKKMIMTLKNQLEETL